MARRVTILCIAMLSYRELLKKTREEIAEIDSSSARDLTDAQFVDVREREEWDEGHIPGAVHVPRGNLESRIEGVAPDHEKKIVLYCASGARSAFAAKTLAELGYEDVVSLQGGFSDWKRNGYDVQLPRMLTPEKRARYARHVAIPEIGDHLAGRFDVATRHIKMRHRADQRGARRGGHAYAARQQFVDEFLS